jgi:hypothetical protein
MYREIDMTYWLEKAEVEVRNLTNDGETPCSSC